jgi:hypothetical protein
MNRDNIIAQSLEKVQPNDAAIERMRAKIFGHTAERMRVNRFPTRKNITVVTGALAACLLLAVGVIFTQNSGMLAFPNSNNDNAEAPANESHWHGNTASDHEDGDSRRGERYNTINSRAIQEAPRAGAEIDVDVADTNDVNGADDNEALADMSTEPTGGANFNESETDEQSIIVNNDTRNDDVSANSASPPEFTSCEEGANYREVSRSELHELFDSADSVIAGRVVDIELQANQRTTYTIKELILYKGSFEQDIETFEVNGVFPVEINLGDKYVFFLGERRRNVFRLTDEIFYELNNITN